jgi:hypothetical protein
VSVRSFKDSQGRQRYAVEFEIRGRRIFRRLPPGATKGQATQLETRLRFDFIDQAVVGNRPGRGPRRAIRAWLEESVKGRKSEKQTAATPRACSRSPPIGAWSRSPRSHRRIRAQELAPATINRRLCILKAAAKFAWRQGWTADNLSPRVQLVPEAKYRRREITLADARS